MSDELQGVPVQWEEVVAPVPLKVIHPEGPSSAGSEASVNSSLDPVLAKRISKYTTKVEKIKLKIRRLKTRNLYLQQA